MEHIFYNLFIYIYLFIYFYYFLFTLCCYLISIFSHFTFFCLKFRRLVSRCLSFLILSSFLFHSFRYSPFVYSFPISLCYHIILSYFISYKSYIFYLSIQIAKYAAKQRERKFQREKRFSMLHTRY